MLTVTENAKTVVEGLTREAELPQGAGLRIAFAPDQAQLQVAVVPDRQPTDVVVEVGDAAVYVAEDAAPALEDQTLDATQTAEGIGFTLTPQS